MWTRSIFSSNAQRLVMHQNHCRSLREVLTAAVLQPWYCRLFQKETWQPSSSPGTSDYPRMRLRSPLPVPVPQVILERDLDIDSLTALQVIFTYSPLEKSPGNSARIENQQSKVMAPLQCSLIKGCYFIRNYLPFNSLVGIMKSCPDSFIADSLDVMAKLATTLMFSSHLQR